MLNSQATIAQAKAWLRTRLKDGTQCPVCTQRVQVYRRKVTSSMASALIYMYRTQGLEWFHLPTIRNWPNRDEATMAYWGLIEEEGSKREDGGRAGYWRVTELGEAFVKHGMTIPKYAHVFDGRVVAMPTNEQVSIKDALGTKFNYADLMAGI